MRGKASWLAALGLAALCGGCRGQDLLVDRCSEVIEYKHPDLEDVDIVAISRDPSASAVTLDFEATQKPADTEISSRILCDFEASERKLERIEIGGRTLSETEVTLVNSELLLRDLSDPERIAGSSSY
jgi:hypothetical protein